MNKVLMVHPDFSRLGGIESYLLKIKPHLRIESESCGNSARPGEKSLFARIRRIMGDYYRFWKKLSDPEVEIVHLNPSLMGRMFYRDWLYLWLAGLKRKKTVVFFHGWNRQLQHKIDRSQGRIFRLLYGRADAFIVLASDFVESLRLWGIKQPVYREVIVIENDVFDSIDLEDTLIQRDRSNVKLLLFPARLIRAKGIFTAIRALHLVQQRQPDIGIIIAGDGEDAGQARELVENLGVQNVHFAGVVSGESKYRLFQQAHLLCFPTEHSEGFPNTIVEAMAFGLPVATRPVGGVKDFFVNGEHGFITDSVEPEVFAEHIETIFSDRDRYHAMARCNHQYAHEYFLASDAAERLERIYQTL